MDILVCGPCSLGDATFGGVPSFELMSLDVEPLAGFCFDHSSSVGSEIWDGFL